MRIEFVFVTKEGDEPDHGMAFDMPGVPRTGDLVTVARPGQAGTASFVVRRIHWTLAHPDAPAAQCGAQAVAGTTNSVQVECEFVPGPYSAEEHKPALSLK